ncbi:MAG: TerB family tellurite resistance protein [Gemmobacter sp.]|jgi:uncharacterized tellurite resistance protein B-like protein|nr:TerB family tellurite resistance protein [Gemmobacter sp.]
MFNMLLRHLLSPAPGPLAAPDARMALAALLVRVARADGTYDDAERRRIDEVLAHLHALGPFEAAHLRTGAEALEAAAPDTVRFTRALKEATALQERQALIEGLWSVALADGTRSDDEEQVLRLVANLLGLTDVESAQARQRAERRG